MTFGERGSEAESFSSRAQPLEGNEAKGRRKETRDGNTWGFLGLQMPSKKVYKNNSKTKQN